MSSTSSRCNGPGDPGCGAPPVPLYQGLIFLVPIVFTLALCLLLFLMYMRSRHFYRRQAAAQQLRLMLATAQPGGGTNGLSAATLASFPTMPFSTLKTSTSAAKMSEDLQCPVCLGEYQDADGLRVLPCHVFHKDCIDAWFRNHSTCPICRVSYQPASQGAEGGARSDAWPAPETAAAEHTVQVFPATRGGGLEASPLSSPARATSGGPAPTRPPS